MRKFVIILPLKIPTHPKCVATLPCEMSSVLKATIDATDRAIGQWRRRLECVVEQQGGYIEHLI